MLKQIAALIGRVTRVTPSKPVFHYAPQQLYSTGVHDLGLDESLLVATRTKIKLLESKLQERAKQPFHATVEIEHPVEFSIYGRENTWSDYRKIVGSKSASGKFVTIPEVHLTSGNEASQNFEFLIINHALSNLVEAKIIFEKAVYYEDIPKARFIALVPSEFIISRL